MQSSAARHENACLRRCASGVPATAVCPHPTTGLAHTPDAAAVRHSLDWATANGPLRPWSLPSSEAGRQRTRRPAVRTMNFAPRRVPQARAWSEAQRCRNRAPGVVRRAGVADLETRRSRRVEAGVTASPVEAERVNVVHAGERSGVDRMDLASERPLEHRQSDISYDVSRGCAATTLRNRDELNTWLDRRAKSASHLPAAAITSKGRGRVMTDEQQTMERDAAAGQPDLRAPGALRECSAGEAHAPASGLRMSRSRRACERLTVMGTTAASEMMDTGTPARWNRRRWFPPTAGREYSGDTRVRSHDIRRGAQATRRWPI